MMPQQRYKIYLHRKLKKIFKTSHSTLINPCKAQKSGRDQWHYSKHCSSINCYNGSHRPLRERWGSGRRCPWEGSCPAGWRRCRAGRAPGARWRCTRTESAGSWWGTGSDLRGEDRPWKMAAKRSQMVQPMQGATATIMAGQQPRGEEQNLSKKN